MIICSLLLEISSFIREAHPQVTKKPKNTTHNKHEKNIGSVFSNESSSVSVLNDSLLYPDIHQQNIQHHLEQETITSFMEVTNNNDNDNSKHISFIFRDDTLMNDKLGSEVNNNDFEINIIDTNLPIATNMSSKFSHVRLPYHSKRTSLKHGKKASFKHKIDRASRNTRRKLSYNTQILDIREQELSENNGHFIDAESILNNHTSGINNIQTCQNENVNDYNDEIYDGNKCFPWIKVRQYFILISLNYFKQFHS